MPLQAGRISEALGRIAYQQGEYQLAREHWSRALDLAEVSSNNQLGVAARIGMGQIHYAQADWPRGLRLHREAAAHLGSSDDSYLASKVALNLGVGSFETGDLASAERQFSHGLAAARRGVHREFEAEAHWHLARAALARSRMDWAVADCRLALDIAARQGFSWLEAAASRTWTEIALARDDVAGAIRSTRHGLELAERIHARAQARQSHLQLAQLLQREGDTEGSLHHLWQHLTLQGEIERLSLSATPESGQAGGASAPISPEERLLQLSARRRHLYARADRAGAWDELQAAARQALGLQSVLLGLLRGPGHAAGSGELRLQPASHAGYLALLERHGGPLALPDAALHPCHSELADLAPVASASQARIELPLFDGAKLAGVLWLVDSAPHRNWGRQDLLLANQFALLAEGLLFS